LESVPGCGPPNTCYEKDWTSEQAEEHDFHDVLTRFPSKAHNA
jgi:hypothetical protein